MTQSHILPKSAQTVQDALNHYGLTCRVVSFPDSTRTAAEAAVAIGCTVNQIAKSLIFKTQETHRPVLVLASGPNRVNEKYIEAQVGEKIIKADAAFTREITGFAIGGIPPVGHREAIELVFIDQDLLAQGEIWAAAGTPNTVFNLKGPDLVTVTRGKVIKVA